jgi:hypothetical protein
MSSIGGVIGFSDGYALQLSWRLQFRKRCQNNKFRRLKQISRQPAIKINLFFIYGVKVFVDVVAASLLSIIIHCTNSLELTPLRFRETFP